MSYLEFQKKVIKQLSELKLVMVELLEQRIQGPTSTQQRIATETGQNHGRL